MFSCHKMTIEFHVWALSQRETITSIRRFIQAKSTQEQKQTKAGGNSQPRGAGQVEKKKTDLEILTSPKGGLHEKYLWKALEKPQIDDGFKERKKTTLKNYAFYQYRTI